jgi:hypothetical protein
MADMTTAMPIQMTARLIHDFRLPKGTDSKEKSSSSSEGSLLFLTDEVLLTVISQGLTSGYQDFPLGSWGI